MVKEVVLIKARGGTPEQRAAIASAAKEMKDMDVDFLNIDGIEGDLSVEVKTSCGVAEAKGDDLKEGGSVLESLISKVKCPLSSPEVKAGTPVQEVKPEEKKEGSDAVQAN